MAAKTFSRLMRSGLSACAILAIAAGCGGSQNQTTSLVPGQSNPAMAELGRLASMVVGDRYPPALAKTAER